MKTCWLCKEAKPHTEFHKDKSRGDGLACRCKPCVKLQSSRWYKNNVDKCAEKHAATYVRRSAPKSPEQRKVERDKSLAAYRAANKDRYKAWTREWAAQNKGRRAQQVRAYQVKKRNATPAWANEFFMDEAYALAKLRTKMFGFAWHVDHIVPIKSKIVCGLHTHDNLRVIPAAENISKGNRYWPDMPATTDAQHLF